MVALKSIHLLLLFVLLSNGNSQTCDFEYLRQPPTMLDCDPLGISIILHCAAVPSSIIVTWYWTQNVSEAGVSGTAILPGNTSNNYQVSGSGTNDRVIGFTVSESTLGYYWCEISNAVNMSLRPSTITPVCPHMNSSQQNKCTDRHIKNSLHDDVTECAEENSTTVISRPPLPTSCAGSSPSTLVAVATTPTPSDATTTLPTNTPVSSTNQASTTILLLVLLVVVSVTLLVSVSLNIAQYCRVKRQTKTTEECATQKSIFQVQQRHSDAGEPEEMTPNVAYASFVMSPHSGKEEEDDYI